MWRRVATGFGLLAVIAATVAVRLPALRSARHVDFDEGVYGVSVLAMRDGAWPFHDVFSSQGPLFLPVLWVFDTLGLGNFRALRVGMVLIAIVVALGVYVVARRASQSTFAALVAAAGVGTAGAGVAAAGAVHSDGLALALGVGALAVLIAPAPEGRWRPVVIGALVGAGMAVKSIFLLPVAVAVAWHYGWRREWRALAEASGAAAILGLVVTLPWGLGNVWDQFVTFHLDVPRERSPYRNLVATVGRMWRRDALFLVLAGSAILGVLIRLGRRRWPAGPRQFHATMLVWLLATAVLLLFGVEMERGSYRFLWFFLAPAAVTFAIFQPPVVLVALTVVGGAFLVPRHFDEDNRFLDEQKLAPTSQAIVAALEALPDGALVLSDDPGFAWIAGRHPPPPLVDVSWARIQSGDLTSDEVLAGAALPETCAVLFHSDRFDFLDPSLDEKLLANGYELAADYGNDERLYLRAECRP